MGIVLKMIILCLFVLGFRPKVKKSFHHAGKERAALLATAAVFSVVGNRGTNKSKLRVLMSPFFHVYPTFVLFV